MQSSIVAVSASLLAAMVSGTSGVAVAAAADDLTIVSKHTQAGRPAVSSTSYLASDHVRMAQAGGSETIVDLKTGVMTTLDGKKKTYFSVTRQDLEDFAVRMKAKMNAPETKRAREGLSSVSGAMAPSFDVKNMGTSRRVAGLRCEEWTITMGEMTTIRECVTSELQYRAHAFEAYKQFAESMRNLSASFTPAANAGLDMAQKMRAMKGYPIASTTAIDVMGHRSTIGSEVIEIRRGMIPASTWEVPAGYTKIDSPMLKALEGQRHR